MAKHLTAVFFLFSLLVSIKGYSQNNVETSDIDRFWQAFDQITAIDDSVKQLELIEELYIQKGSDGLKKIMEARDYTGPEYVHLIRKYPKYFRSIRSNTLRAHELAKELNEGIENLKKIYPVLRPAKIYFTIGCMRTNGTTRDSLVLIGSELAMADVKTDLSEFDSETREWLSSYFKTNPIEDLVLLNVHEYVHTQQNPIASNLLFATIYEGVAEFVSSLAMGVESAVPAVVYGKSNPAVKEKFEREMFYDRYGEWLWSNADNEFNMRDLGYYVGYAMAEKYYNEHTDKESAVKELVELDFSSQDKIYTWIDATLFFSKPIAQLKEDDRKNRPTVIRIKELGSSEGLVESSLKSLTLVFSEPLNGYNTGVDYSDLGEQAFPEVTGRRWSDDGNAWTMDVVLKPQTHYKFWITSNFRTSKDVPVLPYLVEFYTK